jgi:hypothetical protein
MNTLGTIKKDFILESANGHRIMSFSSAEAARKWAKERREKAKGVIPEVRLVKKTIIEEELGHV